MLLTGLQLAQCVRLWHTRALTELLEGRYYDAMEEWLAVQSHQQVARLACISLNTATPQSKTTAIAICVTTMFRFRWHQSGGLLSFTQHLLSFWIVYRVGSYLHSWKLKLADDVRYRCVVTTIEAVEREAAMISKSVGARMARRRLER